MAAVDEVGAPSSLESSNSSNFSGAALLLVVGEPFSEDHKELILERVAKGLRCWEVDCDLNAELQAVAAAAPVGEEGPNGEKVVQHISDNLKIEIVVSGTHQTVCNKIRSLLLTPAKQRHLVYAGYAFQGSGDWVLQDDCLTFATFASIFKEAEVENVLRQQEGTTLSLYTFPEGEWSSNSLAKHPVSKLLKIAVNPEEKLTELAGVVQLGGYLSYLLKVQTVMELHKASDVVGNIRFSRPTLYIFPGCQGDSSLFGISGFNLLVNGGYSRKACFWDFTRHLDRIDAVLLTHLGADNLFGISSVLQRKAVENAHPEIGHMYFNCLDKQTKHSPNGDSHPENGGAHKPASLLVNLVEEGNSIIENLRNLGQSPHPCTGNVVNHGLQPLNLYHKVGHGTLDMYILNPVQDSKEVKEFLSQWNKHVSNFSSAKSQFKVNNKEMSIPLTSMMSIAALLVWRPSAANESITRILFPGSAPQNRLFEGLDKLKGLDIFQHPCCSESSLHAPKGAKKAPAGKGRAPPKSTPPPAAPSPAKAEPRKEAAKPIKATSPAKPTKEAKNTKKMAAGKEDKAEKSPATTPSDTKSPTPAESPKITLTPSNTPAEVSSPEKTDTLSSDVASSHEEAVTPLKEEAVSPAVELPPEPEQPKEPEPAEPELLIPEPAAPAPVQQEVPEPVEAWPEASAQQSLPESQQDITPTETSPGEMPPGLSDPLIPGFGGDAQPPNLMDTAPEADRPAPPEDATIETPEALPEPALVAEEPAAPVAVQPEEKLPEPAENVDLMQPEPRQPDLIADTDQPSQPASQQQLEELGIYDGDEKDVDTTEVVTPPTASQPTLEELGIYDDQDKDVGQPDQPESEQPAREQLPPSDAPEADLPVAEEAKAPAEPDLGVFDGAAPEGLPSPQEPGLEVCPPAVEADLLEKTPAVTEESSPVVDDTPAVVDDTSAVVDDTPAVADDTPAVVDDTPAAVDDTPAVVDDTPAVVDDTPAPEQQGDEDSEKPFKPEMLPDVPEDNGLAELGTAEEPESFRPETLPDVSEVAGLSEVGASEEPQSLRPETLPDVSDGGLEELEPARQDESEPQALEGTPEVSQSPDVVSDPLSSPTTETEQTETESQLPSDLSPPPPAEAPCDAHPLTPPAEVAPVAGVDNSPFEIIDAPTDAPALEGEANPQTNPFIMGFAEDDVQPRQEEFDLRAESQNIPSHNGPLVDDVPAQNPFEIPADTPSAPVSAEGQEIDRDSLEREGGHAEGEGDFDPLQSWGQPMGLPAPSPKKAEGAAAKDPKAATSKNGPAKPKAPGGSAAGAKKGPSSAAKKTAGGPASATSKPRSAPAKKEAATTKREPVKKEEPKKNGAKDAPTKRPAPSSAAGARKPAGRPGTGPAKSEPASKTAGRKTASASGAKTAPAAKPLGPVTPCYLDLTYIPHHGDMSYIDMDFFRRVRAKYYVLSALNPSPQVLNALLEAKETWDNPDLEVTIIPTHDTPTLHHWMGLHREQLSQNKIVVAPSANRCTIQLQDQEASCSAYRLEF